MGKPTRIDAESVVIDMARLAGFQSSKRHPSQHIQALQGYTCLRLVMAPHIREAAEVVAFFRECHIARSAVIAVAEARLL